MSDVTRLLEAAAAGDGQAAAELLPLVYAELRQLAAKLAADPGAQTLGATALVHEAYLRLVGGLRWANGTGGPKAHRMSSYSASPAPTECPGS
jgi:hypothetical protein